jgi:hypothetical protein
MTTFNLSDRPEHIRQFAAAELRVCSLFPSNDGSREQALMLLRSEEARWRAFGPEGHKPTELVGTLMTSAYRQTPRRTLAGMMALVMVAMEDLGYPMSLEKASSAVSEYANDKGSIPFEFWKNGKWYVKHKALTSDPNSLKSIFRKYRSVAHICAAEIAVADHLTNELLFEIKPEADSCFIHTVLYYQAKLSTAHNFSDWESLEIQLSPPAEFLHYGPLLAEQKRVKDLLKPLLDSVAGARFTG